MSLLNVLDNIQVDDELIAQDDQTTPDNPPNGNNTTNIQGITPPPALPNQEMTGYKTTIQQPKTSTTTAKTKQAENTLSLDDWRKMTGQEAVESFYERMKANPPSAPVNPEDQERRLRSQGLLRLIGDGLFTLGEAVGLGMGSSVRKRNMPEGDEFKRADELRAKYGDDMRKWEDSMRAYYDKIYQYNQAQAKDYDKYREGLSTKVSTTTQSGGDSQTYEYENPEIAKRKFDNEKALVNLRGAWNNKSKYGKVDETKWNTHPVGMSGKTFEWYVPSESMHKVTANAISSRMKGYNLPSSAQERILSSIKEGQVDNPSTWSEADNKRYNTQVIDELLQRGEDLIEQKEKALRGGAAFMGNNKVPNEVDLGRKAIDDELTFISNILEAIQGTGFKVKYE